MLRETCTAPATLPLRALERTPDAVDVPAQELEDGAQADARAKEFVASVTRRLASGERNDELQGGL